MMLKIILSVKPQTENASQDLNECVRELARECGQGEHLWTLNNGNALEDIVEDKFKLDVTIPSTLQVRVDILRNGLLDMPGISIYNK